MNNRRTYINLMKNFSVLTIGNFGSKILTYFLLPLYTTYLSTEDYGTFDLLSTTINLILPILTVNASASVMRFALDKSLNIKEVVSTGTIIILKGIVLFFCFIAINLRFSFAEIINDYLVYFIFLYFFTILFNFLNSITKGLEELPILAFGGILHTFILLVLNIIFLIPLNLKLEGYFLANIISLAVTSLYLIVRIRLWRYVSFRSYSHVLYRDMLRYGGPLIITSISWWINNASDRYIVTWVCGLAANGIYSVASKIPSILTTFQNIFNQAWQISAVNEYDKYDTKNFFSNIYNTFNVLNVIACSLLIAFTKVIANLLFAKDFFEAWKYAPFLLISVVFGSQIGVIDGVFQTVKDSKAQSASVVLGAIVNVLMNLLLVGLWGPVGAAISTAMSYAVSWCVSMINVKKYIFLKINIKRHLVSYLILCCQASAFVLIANIATLCLIQFLFVFALFVLYFNDIKNLSEKGLNYCFKLIKK